MEFREISLKKSVKLSKGIISYGNFTEINVKLSNKFFKIMNPHNHIRSITGKKISAVPMQWGQHLAPCFLAKRRPDGRRV